MLPDCMHTILTCKTNLTKATVFTWLNAAATISLVTKIDAATTQTYFKFEEVPGLLCHNVYTLKRRCTQDLCITWYLWVQSA